MSLNIDRLIKAVECAAKEPGGLDYQQELDELLELKKTMEESRNDDIWKGSIEVVTTEVLCELMNTATYDVFGKMARNNGGDCSREEYNAKVRSIYESITDTNLECGYDLVRDLWHDNEEAGWHAEDGTFSDECFINSFGTNNEQEADNDR